MPDHVKPSRLLLRLEAEIAAAKTQLDADCKRAERAAYLARLGRFDEARGEVEALQERYVRQPQIEISVRVNLAEGLIAYFENVGVSTTDRVQRAYALSVAAGLGNLRAICSAWLAQWAYSRLDMVMLARHLSEALSYSDSQNYSARSRACLVAAQALHLAGRPDLAKAWYARSRICATQDGDDVTISALMHNMSWLRMLTMRQAVLTGSSDSSAGEYALLNAESTANLDELKGDSSWQELKPILRAQIVSLKGDAKQALSLYEQHLTSAEAPLRLQANLLADKAWCHAIVGDVARSLECAETALNCLVEETQVDDRAATHSRLAQAFAVLGQTSKSNDQVSLAKEAWSKHCVVQACAVELLATLNEDGRSLK
jgi:tetratricopeptide (TPR) repeat protein